MSGGTISDNTAIDGGGVYNDYGTFTMSGGTISGNTATDEGGGVYIGYNKTFTMSGGTISGNTAKDGGGIHNDDGTFTMSGGTISNNIASECGGGVYNDGMFTMEGASKISGDKASDGGGVYIDTGSDGFTMSGGTISGNTAPGKGGGVYVFSSFAMSGSAKVAADNDVYLMMNEIKVAGALSASSPVATITTWFYSASREVLRAGTGVTITQGICDQFAVTPDGSTAWKVVPNSTGTTGVLQKK